MELWGLINFNVDPFQKPHKISLNREGSFTKYLVNAANKHFIERSEQEIMRNLGSNIQGTDSNSSVMKEPISLDTVKKINFISQHKRPYCNYCGSLCGMYWYKKISDDTGNPELTEKDNEGTDKQANDNMKNEYKPTDAEESKGENRVQAKQEIESAAPGSQTRGRSQDKNKQSKTSRIIEPVEEVKMKKELNDLQFTYVLCASCFDSKKYPNVLTPSDFQRCSIQTLLTKSSITGDEREILTKQELENLEPAGEWTTEETLQLLDSVAKHGEDWDEVAKDMEGVKTKQQCVSHFISLPINENTSEKIHNINAMAMKAQQEKQQILGEQASVPTVFSDVSNPILAQVALFGRLLEHYGLDDEDKQVPNYSTGNVVSNLRSHTKVEDQSVMQVDSHQPQKSIPEEQILSKDVCEKVKEKSINMSRKLLKRERKEMKKLMAMIVEIELKKIANKVEYLDKLDEVILKEQEQIKEMHSQIFAERMSLALSRNERKAS